MAEAKVLTIQGVEFNAPVPYAAGHVLTENEARHLNQTYHENVRNNFAKTVKASLEGAEGSTPRDQLQAKFDEYASTYSLDQVRSVGTGASRTLDPIEKEALSIAKDMVKAVLEKQGRKLTPPKEASEEEKTAYKDKINAKIEEIAGRDEVVAQAKKNVANRNKSLESLAAAIDL